jgi:transposase
MSRRMMGLRGVGPSDVGHAFTCAVKAKRTTGKERRIKRWEHERVVEAMQDRLERMPHAMRVRRRTVEHVFGTIKDWMGRSHFKTRTLKRVETEMSLHVLAYNMKRAIAVLGTDDLIGAMQGREISHRSTTANDRTQSVFTQPR